jgi:hypothetical protein
VESLAREAENHSMTGDLIMFFAPPPQGSVVVLVIVCRHSRVTITTISVAKG